jgi:hypothetical protein
VIINRVITVVYRDDPRVLIIDDLETLPEQDQRRIYEIAENNGGKPRILVLEDELEKEGQEMDDLIQIVHKRVSQQLTQIEESKNI